MAYTDDQMGPRRRALVGSLGGNTGISGAMPGGVVVPPIMQSDPSKQMGMAGVDMSDPRMNQMGMRQKDGSITTAAAPSGFGGAMSGIMDAAAKTVPGGSLAKPSGFGGAMSGIVDAAAKLAPGGSLAKPADASAPADYSKAGQYLPGNGSGYDPTKGLDGGNTGKYKMRNVLSHFDPNKGLTPEIVDALNAQGMGKFRMADGDELVLDDNGADSSFGRTRHFDVIPKFDDKSRDHAWGYYQQDKGGVMQGQAAPRAVNPMFAGSTIGAPLQGDAQGNIQQALQGMGAQNQPSRIQQLIAALQGGGQ